MTMEDSEALGWPSVADLVGQHPQASVALIGAGLNERSLTPGRCDLGPKAFRAVLPRFSSYDVETGQTLSTEVFDAGDLPLKAVSPADAFLPVRDSVVAQASRSLTVLIGGNNAITRPGAHGLGLDGVGVLTLEREHGPAFTDDELAYYQSMQTDERFVVGGRIQTPDFTEDELRDYQWVAEHPTGSCRGYRLTDEPSEEEVKDWQGRLEWLNKLDLVELRKKATFEREEPDPVCR
jgi:hypothetical protein